jgi:glycosyltransferase involved in cell wall biosynthesis
VKCWERLAAAAVGVPGFDLTVYFLGARLEERPLAPNVRFALLAPVFSTRRLPFLSGTPDETDLSPHHPGLARVLSRHDVIHSTGAFFSFGRTARRVAARAHRPLAHSVHTDVPRYTGLYASEALRRLLGEGRLGRAAVERWRWNERIAARMQSRLESYLGACDWVFTAPTGGSGPEGRSSALRRGIDTALFHPGKRDRRRLREAYGIPDDAFLALFVGRVDAGKGALAAARVVRLAADQGVPVRALFAGEGREREPVSSLLGPLAALPGTLPPEELALAYAGADVLLFPSEIEVAPNVVQEAQASGLPVIAAPPSSSFVFSGAGLILPPETSRWADALSTLWSEPQRRRAMGAAARRSAEAELPSWRAVLEEDLVPVWRRLAERRSLGGAE